ncbi:MAG: D-alanyl-D-alanine carboxypeptidase [Actinomycetia bacterium]|nr:D-alanyl-D-alanine carboxypeptidase [Actinomycetes bacterium]
MARRIWAAWLAVLIVLLAAPGARAQGPDPVAGGPKVVARAAVLMDAASGEVLWADHPSERLPVASLTKIMTLGIALRAVARGQAALEDEVPVSLEAYRTGGSQIWLEPGERLTLRQMLVAIAVGSANDAAVAVGEYLAGSTDRFVQAMNAEARRLGLTDTRFSNPHGLHAADHYSSALDMARLARWAVGIPGLLDLTRQREDRTIRNGKGGTLWLVNGNRLLRTFPGTDGLKTGYTRQAGYCIVATARRGDTRLIAVVLGAPSSAARFDSATSLLTWGFNHFVTVPVVRAGERLGQVRVWRGTAAHVDAVAARTVAVTVPRGERQALVRELDLPPAFGAPVAAGQPLGRLSVRLGPKTLAAVPVVAARSVPAVALPALIWRYFLRILA